MKKILLVLILFCFISCPALAELDLSAMTDNELRGLIEAAEKELEKRGNYSIDYSKAGVPANGFCEAFDTMCDFYEEKWDIGKTPITKTNGDFFIALCDDVRLVSHISGERLLKFSVRSNKSDNTKAIHRFYAMISTIEGNMYELPNINHQHKHNAFKLAQPITEEILSDALIEVTLSGIEGYALVAAQGKQFTYYWEYLDNDAWLSVSFAELPGGVY